ncbi:MAG TPA: hypothetical protein DCM28_15690 [Phycisphaerales bacterium]|nr:hypothetical protein [Phycisphaerales bacterium]|tara:strand:- start:519 stop:2054 length:1536 start_codon:yes stop_codon:yes gene_type:complete
MFQWLKERFAKQKKTRRLTLNDLVDATPQYDYFYGYEDSVEELRTSIGGLLPMELLYARYRHYTTTHQSVVEWSKKISFDNTLQLCIASLNGNGHIREQAIYGLDKHHQPKTIAFVLRALSDWVPQVRSAARDAIETMLVPEFAEDVLIQYQMVDALLRVRRTDLVSVNKRILKFLASELPADVMQKILHSEHSKIRLFAFRVLSDRLVVDPALQARAVSDHEAAIRCWFIQQLDRLDDATCRKWKRQLINDPAGCVACRVIRQLDEDQIREFTDVLLTASYADSAPVRQSARFALRQNFSTEYFVTEYRQQISEFSDHHVRPGLIAGLGETGTVEDISLMVPFLSSQRGRVRSAALKAISVLSREQATLYLLASFDDSSRRVQQVIWTVMNQRIYPEEKIKLYELMRTSHAHHALTTALNLLAVQRSWDAVIGILFGAANEQESIRQLSWRLGQAWNQRGSSTAVSAPVSEKMFWLKEAHRKWMSCSYNVPDEFEHDWQEILKYVSKAIQ